MTAELRPTARPSLSDFLLARIAEDEEVARDFGTDQPGAIPDSELWVTEAEHPAISITAARVLAECEAKRRIIAEIREHEFMGYDYPGPILELLALPYRDHPDYDPSWAV